MSGEPDDTKSTAYVLALDVGTSTIRAHVYDNKTIVRGTGSRKVMPVHLSTCIKYRCFFYLFELLI